MQKECDPDPAQHKADCSGPKLIVNAPSHTYMSIVIVLQLAFFLHNTDVETSYAQLLSIETANQY